ncbi:MAG: hypothetical protein U1D35_06390 [Paracoccaceae bacterium]|nr:hypothetical protein [Paracoccaceae bacterium]
MRAYSPAALAYFSSRAGYVVRVLAWFRARNRTTGAEETIGIWNGDDDRNFVIGGVTRTYFRDATMPRPGAIIIQAGLDVRVQRLPLSPLSPPVQQLLRGLDARGARVELHRALFTPQGHEMIEEPHRVFKGRVDEAPIPMPEAGGEVVSELGLVSAAFELTRTVSQKKSDSTQSLRSGDRFRRYADVSGEVNVPWGALQSKAAAPKAAKPASRIGDGSGGRGNT